MAKQPQRNPARFTDVNIGYSVDTEDQRTEKDIEKEWEQKGYKITEVSGRPEWLNKPQA
tara:strand:+ start:1767 stop:1943 length:177 start_codon:yes stop_codon:yes gene_type:complete